MPEVTGWTQLEVHPEDARQVIESEWDPSNFVRVLHQNNPSTPCILSPTKGAEIYLENPILSIIGVKNSNQISPPGIVVDIRSKTIGNCLYLPLNEYIEEGEVQVKWNIMLETTKGHISYYFYVW